MEYLKTSDLLLAEYNPRTISDHDFERLKKSLKTENGKKFFEKRPCLVNRRKKEKGWSEDQDGKLIVYAGNMRFRASKSLGIELIPCDTDEISEEEEKERNIKDNLTAGEWDFDALANQFEFEELTEWGFDEKDLIEPSLEPYFPTGAAFDVEKIKAGIFAEELPKDPKKIIAMFMTRYMAMAQFNKLAQGKRSGYWISALFNPHRLSTRTKKSISYADAQGRESFKKMRAKWLTGYGSDGDIHPSAFTKNEMIGMAGVQVCGEFAPYIAIRIYRDFCLPGAKVLDPCHGWGGRAIGWLAANLGGSYVGYDPAPETFKGVQEIISFLKESSTASTAETFNIPFEDAKIEQESFDFAFTSPPYFDVEHYEGEATSSNRHKTFEEWIINWFDPFIVKVMNSLKKEGKFVINIGGSQYDLPKILKESCEKHNFDLKAYQPKFSIGGTGGGDRANYEFDETKEDEKPIKSKGEPFFILAKK